MVKRLASVAAVVLVVAFARSQMTFGSAPLAIQDDQGTQVSAVLERKRAGRMIAGEVILRRTAGAAAMGPAQLKTLDIAPQFRVTSGGELVLRVPTTTAAAASGDIEKRTLALVERLRKEKTTVYAQPNYRYHITQSIPNDERFADQWHYFPAGAGSGNAPGGIGLPAVWEKNRGSDKIVVAVLDTGILKKHPDIAASKNVLRGFDMITDPFVANDGNDDRDDDATDTGDAVAAGECGFGEPTEPEPSSWHGSHVAGTIGVGGTDNKVGVAGVNWNVQVLPIRVLGKCGGSTVDIADAIRWAAGLDVPGVEQNQHKANVINLSLGGVRPCLGAAGDPAMQSAIDDAVKANVTVVVAAGNEAMDASGASPASCNGVITVAASDFRGHFVSRYSNFGKTVEITAPGGDVRRKDRNGKDPDGVLSIVDGGYAYYNGTSMAAPHVAGVAALLLACNPKLTPAAVLKQMQATAVPRSATEGCPPGKCGAGLLNAHLAMPPACAADK
jgi:serine protease